MLVLSSYHRIATGKTYTQISVQHVSKDKGMDDRQRAMMGRYRGVIDK